MKNNLEKIRKLVYSIIGITVIATSSVYAEYSGVERKKLEAVINNVLSKDPSEHNTDWFGAMPLAGLLSWYRLGFYPEVKDYVLRWLDYHYESHKTISDEEFHRRTAATWTTVIRGYTLLFGTYCGYPGVNFVCSPLYQLTGNERARQVCKDAGDVILNKIPRNELGILQHDDQTSGFTIPDAAYFLIPSLFIAAKAYDKEVGEGDATAKKMQEKLVYACDALDVMAQGISRYQDPSGALHLLVDEVNTPLETTGTIMAAYGIHKAVRLGWIDMKYLDIAVKAWTYVDSQVDDEGNIRGCYQGWAVPAEERKLNQFGELRSAPGMLLTTGAEFEKY
jgi:hypothetical protein